MSRLIAAAATLFLGVWLSSEFSFTTPVMGRASGGHQLAGAAWGDGSALVVWRDGRAVDPLAGSPNQLAAARVTAAGVVLDAPALTLGALGSQSPSVAPQAVVAAGSQWFVAWVGVEGAASAVRVARVSSAGAVRDPGGVLVAPNVSSPPVIASSGSSALVAWVEQRASAWGVYGTVIDANGVVQTPGGTLLMDADTLSRLSLAFDGTSYLLAASRGYTIFYRRVSSSGAPQGLELNPSTRNTQKLQPRLSVQGTTALLTWYDLSTFSTWGTRIDSTGVLDPAGLALPAMVVHDQQFDGTAHCFSSLQSNEVFRVSPSGATLPSLTMPPAARSQFETPALASDGTRTLVARASGGWVADVVGARFTGATGSWLDAQPFTISLGVNGQRKATSSFGSAGHLVVWEDDRHGAQAGVDLYGSVLAPDGAVLIPEFPVATSLDHDSRAHVAALGTGWWVVWEARTESSGTSLMGARVSDTGQVLDPAGVLLVPDAGFRPNLYTPSSSLACGAAQCALVFRQPSQYALLRLDSVGVIDSPMPLGSSATATVAPGDGGYLVVLTDSSAPTTLSARAISLDGGVSAPQTVATGSAIVNVAATSDGRAYWAAWSQGYSPRQDVYFAQLSPQASVVGTPTRLTTDGGVIDAVNLVFDPASQQLVASWRDTRGLTDGGRALYGARITTAGVVLDPNGFLIQPQAVEAPTTSAAPGPKLLVVGHRFDEALQAPRLRATIATYLPQGVACSAATECASGFCVDGVCCNSACGGGAVDCQACSIAAGAPQNGVCTPLTATACDDHDLCTRVDTCQAGVCVGSDPVLCQPSTCHQVGSCAPTTGQCAVGPVSPDGTSCDDQNPCSTASRCASGACVGSQQLQCAPPDACHLAGACDVANGQCSAPLAPNGASCPTGACVDGACLPRDAGVDDAGVDDAGVDAGVVEAGVDAGTAAADAGDGQPTPTGCGCSTSPSLALLAFPWLLARSRRRSGSIHPLRGERG